MDSVKLTFKENERWIYEEICKHSSRGGFVKDVLADYIKQKNQGKPQQKIEDDFSSIFNQ